MFRVFFLPSEQGLDLVRREWCVLSKDTGKFILDRILSGEAREAVVASIHDHLETLATSMRAGEVTVPRYVITKGLNKAPHEYPDAKSQPHVQARILNVHVVPLVCTFVFCILVRLFVFRWVLSFVYTYYSVALVLGLR